MTDEVRDMIGKALDGEPPIVLTYDTVLGAGKRRRARRNLGIVGGAVLGVVAVASVAVTVNQLTAASPVDQPATTGTSAPTPPPPAGCVMPPRTGGFTRVPDGVGSQEELAESARLTAALARLDFRLPVGVTMDPVAPEMCAIDDSWGTTVNLRKGSVEAKVLIETMPRGGQPAGACSVPPHGSTCHVVVSSDGYVSRIDGSTRGLPDAPLVVDTWRPDDTLVRILEAGSGQQLLGEEALVRIASSPELKVDWSGPARVMPPEPSAGRAAQLTAVLMGGQVLPGNLGRRKVPGAVNSEPLAFYVSQGGYKVNVDLVDSSGEGNLFINLNPPAGVGSSVDCAGDPHCELGQLPNGRPAAVSRHVDGELIQLSVNTSTDDGAQVYLACVNQSVRTQSGSKRTRPEPPLTTADLMRIAALPGLHW
jgi:hypothetical protein